MNTSERMLGKLKHVLSISKQSEITVIAQSVFVVKEVMIR